MILRDLNFKSGIIEKVVKIFEYKLYKKHERFIFMAYIYIYIYIGMFIFNIYNCKSVKHWYFKNYSIVAVVLI